MPISLKQLSKFRSVSLDELRVRSRQGAAKLSDRFRRASAPEMSDEELAHEFHPVWRDGTGEEAADKLRCRMRARSRCFLPSLEQRRNVVEMMNWRFPDERDAIINTAEAALRGKFSLLGHASLSFGDPPYSPIDWRFDPVSGKRAPVAHWSKLRPLNPLGGGDPKVVWELNRHAHLVTLGQAYWLTNDNRFAEGFRDQVSSWIDANPVGMGINWASSLEAAFRSIAWLWATQMFVDSGAVTPDFFARLLKSLIEHGRHIETYLSYYFSPNTHLTGEALGLFYLGLALPEMIRAGGWRDLGLRILLEQARKQVREDGVYFEQSSYYHRYTTDFYTHLFALTRANGIGLDRASEATLCQNLEAMLDHLMWITRPDGTSPLFGDDDGGRLIKLTARAANDFRDTLAIGSAIFNRGDWKYVAGAAPAEMLWLIGPEGVKRYDQLKSEPPREISREFKPSGYFVMRDGWQRNSSFVLIDCGPHGAEICCGHAHSDALSIEFASRGVTWIVDPGTYVYAANAKTRDEFRSTASHNTVTVDEEPQSVASTPFSWRTAAECRLHGFFERGDAIFFQGSHNGYERLKDPVKHTRSVLFVKPDARAGLPEYLIVRDRFTANKRHRYAIRYHLAPGCEARSGAGRVEARHKSGAELTIRVICETDVKTEITARAPANVDAKVSVKVSAKVSEGWVSTCYAQCAPAPIALFEAEGEGTHEFLTLIFPGSFDQVEALERQILNRRRPGADSSGRRGLEIVKLPGSAGG
ncbi:MAG TPA: alginate lyase family protein [Blastocatellia bacterium]|jgi:uncharacterized heparinase superfamily protein|nr:alginate lyase family protein [Blastocatellia bacterium]